MVKEVVETKPARHRGWGALSLLMALALTYSVPALVPVLANPVTSFLQAIGILSDHPTPFERVFATGQVLRWAAVILLLLYVLVIERESLASLGLRAMKRKDLWWALGGAAVFIVFGEGLYLLLHGPGFDANSGHGMFLAFSIVAKIAILLNAAVYEEFLFRGLLMERLIRLTGRTWPAAIVSFLVFAGLHYLSGSSGLVETLTRIVVGSAVLVVVYARTRNTYAAIIAHAICDIPGILGW
ncbi:CPBP family intramembrane glutamic endopeptidase [Amycolatopsis jejuensis]|uniref:CPBP family intramembrane glutamic endopeptidase n=1 Tax=Amycolatopsis jejuensis TaxID=330084 RepID=UPI00052470FE|nr:CPBP family intramembrane glutamic endopeptidase [Amycolatopsis jejuensis]